MKPSLKMTDAKGMLIEPDNRVIRRISDMQNWYLDTEAARGLVDQKDPVVYAMLEAIVPEKSGELAYCTTTMFPGRVGQEYFMTKGHFHIDDSTAEIYYTLSGRGKLLAQTREGEVCLLDMPVGSVVHVEPGWAHRTYNVGDEPLVFLAVYPSVAGHDYGSIEKLGFSHTVIRGQSGPELVENSRYTK